MSKAPPNEGGAARNERTDWESRSRPSADSPQLKSSQPDFAEQSVVDQLLAVDRGVDDLSRRWLVAQGVRSGWLEVMSTGPVITARIETYAPGCFDFSEAGQRAFIHPIWDSGDIADLIAWRPRDPSRFWTRLYSGTPLGVEHLGQAAFRCRPLKVYRTPLDWLRSGGDGVFVTSWAMSAPALRAEPILKPGILNDTAHGREIEKRLRIVAPCPEIRIGQAS